MPKPRDITERNARASRRRDTALGARITRIGKHVRALDAALHAADRDTDSRFKAMEASLFRLARVFDRDVQKRAAAK